MAAKELEEFVACRAMEHDSRRCCSAACEYLKATKTVRPGVVTLTRLVASARATASALTYEKVAHLLTDQLTGELDRLLLFDEAVGMTSWRG